MSEDVPVYETTIDNSITTLDFTRHIGEYFKIGDKTSVSIQSYVEDLGHFKFKVTTQNKKNVFPLLTIGQSFNVGKDIKVTVLGYSKKTGRIEIRIKAPKDVDIDRG